MYQEWATKSKHTSGQLRILPDRRWRLQVPDLPCRWLQGKPDLNQ